MTLRLISLLVFIAVLSFPMAALSQDTPVVVARKAGDGMEKEARHEDESAEIRDFKELKLKKPDVYRRFVQAVQVMLARFGYLRGPFTGELNEATRKAIGEYQRYNKLKATSNLDAPTWERLISDLRSVESVPVRLPSLEFFADSWDTFFSARGTWYASGRPFNEPLQTTEIKCYRELSRCIESTAIVGFDRVLFAGAYIYEIERWDSSAIITKPMEANCVSYRLEVKRAEKTVFANMSPAKIDPKCPKSDWVEETMALEDGEKVWLDLKRVLFEEIERILRLKSKTPPAAK